ncbi:MAG: mobilization protein [Faecalibacterium sp.]
MTKTNVQNETQHDSQRHDTPNNKTHVIKFRVTAELKKRHWNSLQQTPSSLPVHLHPPCASTTSKIERTVVVAGGGEETLTAVSTLLAQCSRVGGNLNQLARHFNSGGADTEQLRAKLLDELADLTAFRLNAEKVLGKLYGNAQAYRL